MELDDKILDVTAVIPTCDRYFSTLPLTLLSIATQRVKPRHVIIYDDSFKKVDIREVPVYFYVLKTMHAMGINWEVKHGDGKGQARLHNRSMHDVNSEFIWRIDDDCVAMPDALAILYGEIVSDEKIGAVGGVVTDPNQNQTRMPGVLNGTLDDVMFGKNVQWYRQGARMETSHLYSSFIYRVAAGSHGYDLCLSRAGHREETIFTHEMHRNGWKLVFQPSALTFHYRNAEGGIRDVPMEGFVSDERHYIEKFTKEWGYDAKPPMFAVLNCGLGDHYAFKHVLRDIIREKTERRIIVACCYPDVFLDMSSAGEVEIVSIECAYGILGKEGVESRNVYAHMELNGWRKSGKTLIDGFRALYKKTK